MSDYTPDDVAALLKVKRVWVINHSAELPHYRVGNQIRFTQADIDAIRQMGRSQSAPADASGLTPRSRRSA